MLGYAPFACALAAIGAVSPDRRTSPGPSCSVALSIAFTAGLIRLAARLYANGVSRTGVPIRVARPLKDLRRPEPSN